MTDATHLNNKFVAHEWTSAPNIPFQLTHGQLSHKSATLSVLAAGEKKLSVCGSAEDHKSSREKYVNRLKSFFLFVHKQIPTKSLDQLAMFLIIIIAPWATNQPAKLEIALWLSQSSEDDLTHFQLSSGYHTEVVLFSFRQSQGARCHWIIRFSPRDQTRQIVFSLIANLAIWFRALWTEFYCIVSHRNHLRVACLPHLSLMCINDIEDHLLYLTVISTLGIFPKLTCLNMLMTS